VKTADGLLRSTAMDWTKRTCAPCRGGVPRLEQPEVEKLLPTLDGWAYRDERLHKQFRFRDFRSAMHFVDAMAELAEEEGHHPDFSLHHYNAVDVSVWTHDVGGLSENDFILAGKIDALPRDRPPGAPGP
jgi:4a-hydroxytetrahydrobiopterin dehydratase